MGIFLLGCKGGDSALPPPTGEETALTDTDGQNLRPPTGGEFLPDTEAAGSPAGAAETKSIVIPLELLEVPGGVLLEGENPNELILRVPASSLETPTSFLLAWISTAYAEETIDIVIQFSGPVTLDRANRQVVVTVEHGLAETAEVEVARILGDVLRVQKDATSGKESFFIQSIAAEEPAGAGIPLVDGKVIRDKVIQKKWVALEAAIPTGKDKKQEVKTAFAALAKGGDYVDAWQKELEACLLEPPSEAAQKYIQSFVQRLSLVERSNLFCFLYNNLPHGYEVPVYKVVPEELHEFLPNRAPKKYWLMSPVERCFAEYAKECALKSATKADLNGLFYEYTWVVGSYHSPFQDNTDYLRGIMYLIDLVATKGNKSIVDEFDWKRAK